MKKLNLTSFFFLLLLALSVSCSKEEPVKPSIVGYWTGLYGGENNVPNAPYTFLLNEDLTMKVYSNNVDTALGLKATGTYSINDNIVRVTYNYYGLLGETYSALAIVDEKFTVMSGTWGYGKNYSGGGMFSLVKK